MPIIAIDYTPAYEQGGGIGRYVRELTVALAKIDHTSPYRLFVSGAQHDDLSHMPSDNFVWKPTAITPKWLARIWHRARLPIPVEVFTGKVNLFHATDFVLPPTLPTTKTLLTVHDLSFIRVPETASPKLKAYLDTVVPRSVRNTDHILADSQATKDDLIDLYDTPADKITVLLSGVNQRFKPVDDKSELESTRDKYNLGDKRYVFSVGTVQPRKNYSRVIRSVSQLRQNGFDIHYVIAGGKGWLEDEMYETIQETKMEEYVQLLGFVDDVDLPALYSGSECLIIPSLYEGFGLPILEAMACGVPVITSNVSSLPEVAGEATLLIDPFDTDAITESLHNVLTNLEERTRLIKGGFQQVSQFTWERSARQLKAIYDMVLST